MDQIVELTFYFYCFMVQNIARLQGATLDRLDVSNLNFLRERTG